MAGTMAARTAVWSAVLMAGRSEPTKVVPSAVWKGNSMVERTVVPMAVNWAARWGVLKAVCSAATKGQRWADKTDGHWAEHSVDWSAPKTADKMVALMEQQRAGLTDVRMVAHLAASLGGLTAARMADSWVECSDDLTAAPKVAMRAEPMAAKKAARLDRLMAALRVHCSAGWTAGWTAV